MDNRNNFKKDYTKKNGRYNDNYNKINKDENNGYYKNNKSYVKQKRPMPFELTEVVAADNGYHNYTYDFKDVIAIFKELTLANVFNLISIPVYMYNSDITMDPERRGSRIVGYVNSVSMNDSITDEGAITITAKIYPNMRNAVEDLKLRNGRFHVKVSTNNGVATKVIEITYYGEN